MLKASSLSELACSKKQHPDVFMHLKKDVTAALNSHFEIPEDTLRKCRLLATDLRLRRIYDETVASVTAFDSGKNMLIGKGSNACVVKLNGHI